jgi:hypothetical protein
MDTVELPLPYLNEVVLCLEYNNLKEQMYDAKKAFSFQFLCIHFS